jgi:hypothetical protein
MKKERKPTRRWIARKLVYAEMRQYVKAELQKAEHRYDTLEYSTARWKSDYHYGRAMGMITMAVDLGALEYGGLSESFRLEKRVRQVTDACIKRCKKIVDQKYAKPETERTAS